MRAENPPTSSRRERRGVTLIEMLVVVALVVLMMLILASIFQVATGAISALRTNQELDNNLRFLDMTIRQDLAGVTAKMTPPNDPAQNAGYFTYYENAPADVQGEDTDDAIAFTTKAPEGQFFTGRVWIPPVTGGPPVNSGVLPQVITSQTAEVIYFLRNGNLYRRVLLVVPERNGKLAVSGVTSTTQTVRTGYFYPDMFGQNPTSWMGVNDISARMGTNNLNANSAYVPIPNTLGALTNRENRFASPRFANDFWDLQLGQRGRDGIPDDFNGDGIPDYYPTLTKSQVVIALNSSAGLPAGLMNEDSASMPGGTNTPNSPKRVTPSFDVHAFPYIYPWMTSVVEKNSVGTGLGWLHAFDSGTIAGAAPTGVLGIDHAPLEFGDSLPVPIPGTPNYANQIQSWFGFPTWRETASVNWQDPIFGLGAGSGGGTSITQAVGLQIPAANVLLFPNNVNLANANMLPPVGVGAYSAGPPFGSDNAGGQNFITKVQVWEDDLLMTGVRSFDVKAIDLNCYLYNAFSAATPIAYNATYFDLGYASTDYVQFNGVTTLRDGTPAALWGSNNQPQGLGHEGRMPPLPADNRVNPSRPFVRYAPVSPDTVGALPYPPLTPNNFVGDSDTSIPRLRRVWDSWSTDYTNAPGTDINLRGHPSQPWPLDRPIYPSYPPPYTEPLRGIQIQIRVVDPKNQKVKLLTIRQDFSEKL